MIYRNNEMFRLLCLVSSSKNDLHIFFFYLMYCVALIVINRKRCTVMLVSNK